MPVDFDTAVLARSHHIPVLVDFWAPWCGPCRALSPTLDKLAAENAGRWELCKVNTDEAPDVAQRYEIRGIPAVKLFVNGKVVKAFTGAWGKAQIQAWLHEALPSPEEAHMKKAEAAIAADARGEAMQLLKRVLELNPSHDRARIRMAQLAAVQDLGRAADLVHGVHADHDLQPVVTSIAILVESQSRPTLPAGPGLALYEEALSAIAASDYDAALQHLIGLLQSDRFYGNDAARKLGIAIFTVLGPRHALTLRHRRTFDMWLY